VSRSDLRTGVGRPDLGRRLVAAGCLLAALGLAVFGWVSSRLGEYSVMAMGHDAVHGAGPYAAGRVSVTALRADPARPADVRVELVARSGTVTIPGGRAVEGYTVNGTSPGPTIHARQGQLVEVTLVNESVRDGVAMHWHGVDVPNAADGVAGITQDAVPVGGRYVYRFVVKDAGTYWYHSHQISHEQVERGLLGALVVSPAAGPGSGAAGPGSGAAVGSAGVYAGQPVPPYAADVVALLHVYEGQHTLGGRVEDERVVAAPGSRVRVRVVNTDQGTAAVWSSVPYRIVSLDGHDVVGPGAVEGRTSLVPAGGRVDVEVTVPSDGTAARVHVGGARSVVAGPGGATVPAAVSQPREQVDLLSYGKPAPLGFDPSHPDRTFDYAIGRRIGIIDGRPGVFWTINGRLFPDVPMFHVREGDVVRMRISNNSDEVHPMHLHGHHVVVLSRDSVAAQGSPWWVDTLDVRPGETYEVAFVADNPGIWSDHCHTLPHAVDGLVAHLMYDGVTTPFTINGHAGNQPE
jgi:FtsP/CotA-like multicopper oxidase with cupredoxin domain